MVEQRSDGTAVVVGGSMAGLLAARVLAGHFERVLVLERDRLPDGAGHRKGVPQAHHAHAILDRGLQILQRLFPGLTGELEALGAPRGVGRMVSGGALLSRHPAVPEKLFISRPALECAVRRRVRAIPNVAIMEGCTVLGLVTTGRGVTGVRLTREAGEEVIPAALVVDAAGRGSRTPTWLASLGFPAPRVEQVEVRMSYATRLYRREPAHLDGDLMINVAATPGNRRACGMLAQEGDRWVVTLAGYLGDHPPTNDEGFLAFARTLPVPDVYEVIRRATPLSEAIPYRFRANERRRYERLETFPGGLLVIGDALCSFSPIYGQGMSVAAMEAELLEALLARGRQVPAHAYFRAAARVIDIPWSLTVGGDRRVTGAPVPAPRRLLDRYLGRLLVAARRDPELALAFLRVGNLLAPPSSLLHPRLALRVVAGGPPPRPNSDDPAHPVAPSSRPHRARPG